MTLIQCGMRALHWPHALIREGDQGKSRKQVLARDEKLDNIVHEPSMHMKDGKQAI